MSLRLKINNQKTIVSNEVQVSNFNDEDPRIPEPVDNIPDKFLVGVKLDDYLPNYRDKRKNVKNQKEINFWNQKIIEQLKLYDSKEDKYNFQLVKGIMEIVERYMIYDEKLGSQKKQVVLNCCLKFFDNNEKLLECVIEDQLKSIVKSSYLTKLLAKLEIFFFSK